MSEYLKTSVNLVEFFTDKVKEALKIQKLQVSDEVEFYVVQLLTNFANSENFFSLDEQGKRELRPLALRLYDATFAAPDRQFVHLKGLGDSALYQAGVFSEGVHRGAVNLDYYISMGGTAYQSLANLTTSSEKILADMFAELAERFAQLVEILHLTCQRERANSHNDLLQLFERYQKTGSLSAKKILEEQGLLPASETKITH